MLATTGGIQAESSFTNIKGDPEVALIS